MPERQVITSLTGTVAPLLTLDTTQAANVDFGSIYLPRMWKKTTPFVKDDLTLEPLGQSVMNQEMAFELPKFAHLLLDLAVEKVSPSHTVAPAGNPADYVDFLGYADFDYLRTNFASNLNFERRMYDLYFQYRRAGNDEKQATEDYLVGGNLTTAQRSANLANGFTTITDADLPFSRHLTQAFPIHVLSQKTRFVYKSQPFANLIHTPVAGTTVTPNGPYTYRMLLRVAHLTGSEADIFLRMSQDKEGISYMIHQNVRQESDNNLTATVTGTPVRVRLVNLTKPLRYIAWALIPTKLNNNTGRNDYFFFAPTPLIGPVPPGMTPYAPITSWSIEANGQIVQRTVTRDWTRMWYWTKFHPSRGGDEIFEQNYAEFPHSVNAATGYLDYTNLNNPVLQVIVGVGGFGFDPDTGAPNPQNMTLVVNCEDYNFWVFKSGNFTRTFN